MAKFINTQRKETLNSLVDGFKERLKNPYYLNLEAKPTITVYYNIDLKKSTLDEASRMNEANIGPNCPIRFNKIDDFYIYGMDKIATELEQGDYGLETNSIEGEAIILPNTIVPYPGDYFKVDLNYLKDIPYLFKVISVNVDTLEDGANFYKINYKLDRLTDKELSMLIVDEFSMVVNNVGTNYNSIIRKNDYNFIETMENISTRLKEYYKHLFYSIRVQTFVYNHNYNNFYDSFMIEFIKRNKILDGTDEFLYITHQTTLQNTFPIDYDRTFFRKLELKDIKGSMDIAAVADYIDEPLSILKTRIEPYFSISFANNIPTSSRYSLQLFDIDVIEHIKNNEYYKDNNYNNAIIKHFNNAQLSSNDIDNIENIVFEPTMRLFYDIPVLIYCIESAIQSLLVN